VIRRNTLIGLHRLLYAGQWLFSVTPTLTALKCILTKMSACRIPQVSEFRHEGQICPWLDRLEARSISRKTFKSIQLAHIMMGESCGGPIALQAGKDNRSMAHSEGKSQNPERNKWSI
jgi:hypothetical protein